MEKQKLYRLAGSPEQLFGIRDYRLIGGKADHMRAVELYNLSGLSLTVLPDRGMDIGELRYRGQNLSFLSNTGLTSPVFFQEDGSRGFMRSFGVGFLTTGGLSYMGASCEEAGEVLGLHGVISNTPAQEVSPAVEIRNDGAEISLSGKVKEARVFGPHLLLTRKITCGEEESGFSIHDSIENCGFEPSPLMILYHMNFGYPMLSPGCELLLTSRRAVPRDEAARKGLVRHLVIEAPADGAQEQVFFHTMAADRNGLVHALLINHALELAVMISYPAAQLPCFTQWKCMRSGEYVLGLEPGNCNVNGRAAARADGSLPFLAPGEIKTISIAVEILSGKEAIAACREQYFPG